MQIFNDAAATPPQHSAQEQRHRYNSANFPPKALQEHRRHSSSTVKHFSGSAASKTFQGNLFTSSSHHTSHTAAAGDLLTMSRRALCPPQSKQGTATTRKRSVPISNTNGNNTGQLNLMSMSDGNVSYMSGQQQKTPFNTYQHIHAPQHTPLMVQSRGIFPNDAAQGKVHFNYQAPTAIQPATYVSSSSVGSTEDNEESYQLHRKKKCRRITDDSSEMMEE